jgi:hypothetical protein
MVVWRLLWWLLQLAAPTVVVVSWVTYETSETSPPMAMIGTSPLVVRLAWGPYSLRVWPRNSGHQLARSALCRDSMQTVYGVSHLYEPPVNRSYLLHFVKFDNLQPRAWYSYKVKSGSAAGVWSDVYQFRAPYDFTSGITRIATYGMRRCPPFPHPSAGATMLQPLHRVFGLWHCGSGDMGHSHYNNMGNLMADCHTGMIDAIVHMGGENRTGRRPVPRSYQHPYCGVGLVWGLGMVKTTATTWAWRTCVRPAALCVCALDGIHALTCLGLLLFVGRGDAYMNAFQVS